MTIIEENLTFTFNEGIGVINYDKDSFYIEKFQSILNNYPKENISNKDKFDYICKKFKNKKEFTKKLNKICPKSLSAVDIIAYDETTSYFIEIKDYRNPEGEEKDLNILILTLIKNCLDSYSGILGMQFSENKSEQKIAKEILSKKFIEFIVHIEIPNNSNTFDKDIWNIIGIQDAIEQRNNFSHRIRVVSIDNLPKSLPWIVKET